MKKMKKKVPKIGTKVKLIPSKKAEQFGERATMAWFDYYWKFGKGSLQVTGNSRGYCKVKTRRFYLFTVRGKIPRLFVRRLVKKNK